MFDWIDYLIERIENRKNKHVIIYHSDVWITKPELIAIEHVFGSLKKFVEFMDDMEGFRSSRFNEFDPGHTLYILEHAIYYYTETRNHVASKDSAFGQFASAMGGDLNEAIKNMENAIKTMKDFRTKFIRYIEDIQKLSEQKNTDLLKHFTLTLEYCNKDIEKAEKEVSEAKQIKSHN